MKGTNVIFKLKKKIKRNVNLIKKNRKLEKNE